MQVHFILNSTQEGLWQLLSDFEKWLCIPSDFAHHRKLEANEGKRGSLIIDNHWSLIIIDLGTWVPLIWPIWVLSLNPATNAYYEIMDEPIRKSILSLNFWRSQTGILIYAASLQLIALPPGNQTYTCCWQNHNACWEWSERLGGNFTPSCLKLSGGRLGS